MVYRFREGYHYKGIEAQDIGDTLDAIRAASGGRLIPGVVVEESRPEDAPLHPCFTWDDAIAAEKCREDEARRVIRSYVVVTVDADGAEREELANVSVANPYDEEGPAYLPTRTALDDPDLRARIIDLARAQLAGWQARYGHLEELAAYVEAIRLARQAEARQPIPARRRRADRRQPAAPAPA